MQAVLPLRTRGTGTRCVIRFAVRPPAPANGAASDACDRLAQCSTRTPVAPVAGPAKPAALRFAHAVTSARSMDADSSGGLRRTRSRAASAAVRTDHCRTPTTRGHSMCSVLVGAEAHRGIVKSLSKKSPHAIAWSVHRSGIARAKFAQSSVLRRETNRTRAAFVWFRSMQVSIVRSLVRTYALHAHAHLRDCMRCAETLAGQGFQHDR